MRSRGWGVHRSSGAALDGGGAPPPRATRPVVSLSGTLGHLAAPLRQHFQVIYLPTDDRPTILVPHHTGMLDGSLIGSMLAEAQWIDSAAMAFLAQAAGNVVTTWTGEALPPLHTCAASHRSGVVIGTSSEVHQRLLEIITAHAEGPGAPGERMSMETGREAQPS